MYSISDSFRLLIERYDKGKQEGNQYEMLKYGILAEAKSNKDLATIICRTGAKNVAERFPKLFGQFATDTSGVLLSIGLPAYVVFGDKNNPNEEKLKEFSQLTYKKLQKKTSAELYEFYVRKCNLIKSLYIVTVVPTDFGGMCMIQQNPTEFCGYRKLLICISPSHT